MKKILVWLLSCTLLLNGCTGILVKRGKVPVETKTEKVQDGKVLFLSKVPTGEYKKARLSANYKVSQAEDRMLKSNGNWKLFINDEPVVVRNWGGKGKKKKLYTAWVSPGHVFAAKFVNEDKDGNKIYKVEFLGRCGNDVEDLMVLESPTVYKIYERYRDIDYTPAIWAFVGGVLVGLGLGYLFWFGKGATILASSGSTPSAATPCPTVPYTGSLGQVVQAVPALR